MSTATATASWDTATATERKLVLARLAYRAATETVEAAIVAGTLHTQAAHDALYALDILDGAVARLTARYMWETDQ